MRSTVGVYENHEKALKAIKVLQGDGFPVKKLSLIGKAELIEDHMKIKSTDPAAIAGVSVGVVTGPILGILTGVGIISIPGFGFLFGAGALVGALAGFDFGLVGGGIVTLLTSLFTNKEKVVKYHEHLKEGKFLVVAQGTAKEVAQAKDILSRHGQQVDLHSH